MKFTITILFQFLALNSFSQLFGDGKIDSLGKQGVWHFEDTIQHIKSQTNYINDTIHGKFIEYDDDSLLVKIFNFNYGLKDGACKLYYKNRLSEIDIYDNDSLIQIMKFHKGRLWSEIEIKDTEGHQNEYFYKNNGRISAYKIFNGGVLLERTDYKKKKYRVKKYENDNLISDTGWIKMKNY